MTTNQVRREYEKPTMKVYVLKKQPQILVGSGMGDPDDYNNGGDPFNF